MSSNEDSKSGAIQLPKHNKVPCYCGWEARLAYGIAVTLAVFEAKRFFMLILELTAEWPVLRFAGGLRPVILTLVDIGLGLPTALTTVRAIRSNKRQNCYTGSSRTLGCLGFLIILCVVMNIATLISIGCHISVRKEAIIDIFNSSMRLYVSTASCKYTIDEIQIAFQCCGYSSYEDWFLFDWQRVDYAPRDEMEDQDLLSDERIRDQSVPYSCCNMQAMMPCIHSELLDNDIATINRNGCVEMLTPILLRIVIVAYLVTSTLLLVQTLLTFLIAKICRKIVFEGRRDNYNPVTPANRPYGAALNPARTVASGENDHRSASSSCESRGSRFVRRTKKMSRHRAKKIKRGSTLRCIRSRNKDSFSSFSSDCESESSTTRFPRRAHTTYEVARIKPSVHQQHTIPKEYLYNSLTH